MLVVNSTKGGLIVKRLDIAAGVGFLLLISINPIMAEPTHPNEIGLYTEPHGLGPTGTSEMGNPVTVYLVMTKPKDPLTSAPYSTIWGFALSLVFDPVPENDLLLLDTILPPMNIDIGRYKDINGGILEFVVGWSYLQPAPVVVFDEAAVLAEFTFLNLSTRTTAVRFEPVDAPSTGGELVFVGGGDPPHPEGGYPQNVMYTVSGSFDDPVFVFNGLAIQSESMKFGQVKALYR
jgi:hypothetical protein